MPDRLAHGMLLPPAPTLVDRLPDGGPVYAETQLDRFIVEPLNAASNLLFLALVLYWGVRVGRAPGRHAFIARALPVLFIGFVGGTVYHAFRAHPIWLALDWLPIAILTLATSYRYLRRLGLTMGTAAWVFSVPFVAQALLAAALPEALRPVVLPAVGYVSLAALVAGPIAAYLAREPTLDRRRIVAAVGLFVVAITFRSIDRLVPPPLDDVGSHFLWHIFGAASSHMVIAFLYMDDLRRG